MKMFSMGNLNLIEKINLYFHDYSIVPLLIQENYLRIVLLKENQLEHDNDWT